MIEALADIAFEQRLDSDAAYQARLAKSLHDASEQASRAGTNSYAVVLRQITEYIDRLHG